jgi:hypothetical protein
VGEALAALAGAAVAGTVAVLTQFLGVGLQSRAKLREMQRARLVSFLTATYGSVLAISDVALARDLEKAVAETRTENFRNQANAALTEIEIYESRRIVDSAKDLDASLVALLRLAR